MWGFEKKSGEVVNGGKEEEEEEGGFREIGTEVDDNGVMRASMGGRR